MRATGVAIAVLLAVVLSGCGGSSSKSSTPEEVCTQITNIAGTLKNLRTGVSSGQASIDAIQYTTSQLQIEFKQLGESVRTLDDPNVGELQSAYADLRRIWVGLPPGTTPSQAQAALAEPAAAVKDAGAALADSLECPRPQ